MVFQHYALDPHMTVAENMALPLPPLRPSKAEIETAGPGGRAHPRYHGPAGAQTLQLSGGESQRVAIGRAMVRRRKVFLMDEPLSNLDAMFRMEMRAEIKSFCTNRLGRDDDLCYTRSDGSHDNGRPDRISTGAFSSRLARP